VPQTDGRTNLREWVVPAESASGKAWALLVSKGAPLLRARGSGSPAVVLTLQGEQLVNSASLGDIVKREVRPLLRKQRRMQPRGLADSRLAATPVRSSPRRGCRRSSRRGLSARPTWWPRATPG
jgi:hypothetical protein